MLQFLQGVNGSGKTTLYYNELEKGAFIWLRVNIDEIVSSFGDWRSEKDQTRATKIALRIRKTLHTNPRASIKKLHFVAQVSQKVFSTLKWYNLRNNA